MGEVDPSAVTQLDEFEDDVGADPLVEFQAMLRGDDLPGQSPSRERLADSKFRVVDSRDLIDEGLGHVTGRSRDHGVPPDVRLCRE